MVRVWGWALLLAAGAAPGWAQGLTINSRYPARNSHAAGWGDSIAVTFSLNLQPGTVNSSSFVVYGNLRGYRFSTISVNGNTAVLDPDVPFWPGEEVTVTLTTTIRGGSGQTLATPAQWQFRAKGGLGSGKFSSATELPNLTSTFAVALGDLDGDGDLDAYLANNSSTDFIARNDGNGNFSLVPQGVGNVSNTHAVKLGDLDRDGDMDIILGGLVGGIGTRIIRNNGATYSLIQNLNIPAWRLDLNDIDRDGDLDLVVGTNSNEVWVCLNNGNGTFSTTNPIATSPTFQYVALRDLDSDDDLDMVYGISGSPGLGQFLQNTPTNWSARPLTGGPATYLTTGDLDHNGTVDIVTSSSGVIRYFSNTSISFNQAANFSNVNPRDLALGDLTGDGNLDLFAVSEAGGASTVRRSLGGFASELAWTSNETPNSRAVALGDLDGDGDLDAVVANSGNDMVYFNEVGIESFAPAVNAVVPPSTNVVAVFNNPVVDSTVNDGNFVVYGDVHGYRRGTVRTSGDSLILDPDVPFAPGERVQVLVDTTVATVGGPLEEVEQWSFRVAAALATAQFLAAVSHPVVGKVAVGHLNNDSLPDFIFVRSSSSSDRIAFFQNASGGFDSVQVILPANVPCFAAEIADLDGDGDNDAFIGVNGPNRVLLNDGNGTLTANAAMLGTAKTLNFALGDVDADGDLDVLTANENSAGQLWRNQGNATFVPDPAVFPSGMGDVGLADLDGDGDLDAVFASANGSNNALLRNDGAGGFTAWSTFGSTSARGLALGDLDGDGDQDIAIANQNGSSVVWRNNGTGSFANYFNFNGDSTNHVALGDLDGDGDLDAWLGNGFGNFRRDQIWLNDGDATFTFQGLAADSTWNLQTDLVDLDGDGDLDALSSGGFLYKNQPPFEFVASDPPFNAHTVPANASFTYRFSDLLNPATVDSTKILMYGNFTGYHAGTVTVGDSAFTFTPDAPFMAGEQVEVALDSSIGGAVVTLGSDYQGHYRIATAVAPGTMVLRQEISMGSTLGNVALGDLDNDGDLDAFVGTNGPDLVLLNRGDGSFAVQPGLGTVYTHAVCLGDLDRDGDLDALSISGNSNHQVWENDGNGNFSPGGMLNTSGAFYGADLGDLNGDGYLDVYVARVNGDIIWYNDQMGNFINPSSASNGSVYSVELLDFDRDGDLDVYLGRASSNLTRENTGNGNFSSLPLSSIGATYRSEKGDLNGDGMLDVFTGNSNSVSRVWLGDGMGGFSAQSIAGSSSFTWDVDLGDVDGDGDLDALTGNRNNQANVLWRNAGNASFVNSGEDLGTGSTFSVALGDLDGDGDLDAFVFNIGSSSRVYLNQIAIDSVSPAASTLDAPATSNITVHFRDTVLSASNGHVIVHGDRSGYRSGSVSINSTTLTFTPDAPFAPGEEVSVLLDSGIVTSAGTLTQPRQWTFRVAAAAAAAQFIDEYDLPRAGNLAVGDLNGDGRPDVVNVRFGPNLPLWISFNNGDGTYSDTTLNELANAACQFVELGDLNGDGHLDAFVTTDSNDVVLLNNGSGVLNFVGVVPLSLKTRGHDLADVDGDGDLDVMVAVHDSINESILWRNDGTGNFSDSLRGFPANARDVELDDLDGDGDPDAFFAVDGGPDEVWLNNGAGEFTLTTQSFLSGAKMEVELGDLDGDGDVDAVVIENNQVLGLVNDGSANFTAVTISSPADLCCGELGDLDGDGDLDLMIGRTGNLRDTVLINNSTPGNFAFVAGASLGALDNTEDLALADMDGDGDLDGVINRAVIYFNQSVLQLVASDPPFNSHRAPRDSVFAFTFNNVLDPSSIDSSKVTLHGNLSGYHAGTITVFDSTIYYDPDVPFFPGEKVEVILDSAIRGPLLSLGKSVHGHFRVRAGVGPAVFELNPQSFGSDDTRNISLGDFDEDGYLDLFIAKRVGGFGAIGKSPNEVWLNNGDGTFRQHGPSLDNERSRMAGIGDFDRDGHLDAYVINSTDPNRIYYGDGLGGFGQPVQSTTGPFGSFFYGVALGDLDGDGDLDAVECGSINVSRILINNGARNFVPQSPSFSGISRTGHAELKDLDGDQDLDIFFVPRQSGSQNCIWYNDGNANFTSAGNINSLGQSDEIALGDLNQDGLYDAVIAFDNSLYLWMQDSTGGFPYNGQQVDSRATAGIDLADLDGDGDLDLLAAAPDPGDTSRVWINDGNGNFTLGNTAWGPDESFGVTAGDLDNDGDLDIAWGNHFRTSRVFFNRVPALALDSVFPHPNARNTSPLTEIRAHYDEAVYPPSVAPKTLAAYGSYSGYRAGTFSTDTSRAQLQPTPAFLPGERVHVLADTALGAVNIGSLRDFQWEFTVAVPSGFARFVEDLDFADTTQTDARAIALADLNGDTLLDAVVGIGTKNVPSAILINTGGQLTASLQPQLRSDSTAALALGDLDGDGDPDLFEANHTGPHRIYRNGPNHIFVPVDSLPGSPVRALQLADLDADADLDALLLLENGPHQIWRNDGTGRFTPAPGGFGSADAYDLAFADFDRDGDLDLYLGVDGNGDEIWENDGRGNFTLSAQVLGFYDSRAVAVADLNGDHYPDVLVAHALPPYFVPYFNDQSGNLRDSLGFGSHPASDIRLGDLDADGDSDLWALGANAQPSRIYRNGGLGDFTPTAQELMNSQGGALALGDLDQDGDLDAFAANAANGSGAIRDQIWINCDVPPVDLGPDTVLCAGESIVLESGAGPFTRVWQNGLSSNQTFTASATGTYFVQVTNQDGCSAYDTVRVWVQPLPPVAVQDLDSLGYCPGDTVALAADRDAYALRLDGVNDFISADTYPGITGQSARTLEAWVRITDNLQNGAVIATWGAAQVGAQMEFRLNDDAQAGALGALMLDAGGGWKIGTTPVNDSAWHHVALVLDSGATVNVADALLYLDGVEEHYTAVNPVPVNTVAGPDLRIGQAAVGGNLEGEIGELRLWRTARSPAQITADQFVVFGPNVPDLALLWRFTEGLGSGTLADSSGSGHAGTLRFIDLQNNWRPALPGRDLFWDMGDGTAFSGISAAHVYGSNLSYNGRHQVTSTRWGCEASQAFAVNFDQAPNVFISSASGPFCENEPPILLTGRSGLAPGTFTGNGLSNVQDSTAWFTPAAAGVGTTPIVYTVNSPAGCTYSRSEIYVVNARPGVSMAPIPLLYNDTDPPQSLSGTPAGGSFSGPGVTGNSFAPAIAMVGLHPIVYTYADPNGCVGRDTVLVEVIGPNSATIQGILGLFCANDTGTYALSGVPFDPQGRFFGDGVDSSGNYVPANGTGLFDTIHYVYRDLNASNVQDTVTRTIGVRSAPTADLLPVSDPFCRNVNLVLLEDSLEVAPGGGTTVFSGSGIVNPSGQFSPLLADTGRHVITATYTALNGCTAVDSMALVVTAPAPGQVFLPQTSFCFSDSAVALGGTPSSGTFSGLGVVGTDFQPDFAGPGLHILTYNYTDANGCAGTVQQAVQVFPNPPVSFSGLALQYCEDAPATSLFGTPQGGTFSGPGVNPLGNGFVFAAGDAGPGLHSVAYEFTDQNGCLGSSSQSVLVDTLPVVSFAGLDSTYCFGGASTELTGTPPGGLFTGSGIYSGNRFRADFAGPGPHPIAYTFTDGNGCSDLSQAMTEVFALPPVGLSSPAITLFQDSDPDALNYLVGTPPGGIFSGPGLTQNADTADFSPMVAQGGNHFLTYSVADSGTGCSDTARVRVTVIPAGTEAISGLDRDYCVSAGGSSLLAVFPPSNVPGFFRGPGVDSTGVFRPDLAGVGLHLIRFIRPSIPDTLRRLTRVHPDPQVTFAPTDRDYCPGEPVTNLFGQAAPLGGTFSGNGVQGTGFDPDLAGVGPDTIVYTYGVTYGSVTCRAEARAVFTVHALPEDSLLTAGPYCPNDPPVRLAGFNGYPTVDFGVAGQPDSLFRPMVLGPGDWGVEYTFQDSNGCTGADARVVTVSPEAQASILNLAPRYCQNADPVVLVGSEAVGYFYGPGVDSVTRTFSPGTLPVDTHTVAYVFTDANACTDTLFQTVIVDSLPTVTLSSPVDSLCQDAAALTLTGAPVLGLFSGEGIVNAAGGIFVPDSAAVGTHPITYTFTDSRGCAGRDTVEIFVKRVPTLSLSGLADTLCRGDSVLALGALPPGGMFLGAGIVDSVDGIFNPDSADLGLNAVGYAVDSAGCSAEIAVTTVVNPLPVATFFGLALEYCADAAADSLFGVRSGTFSGVGVTDGPGLNGVFAPVVADTGDHQVVHAVTELGCTAIASVAVRVHPLPVVSFTGLAAQYCQDGNNEAYTLTGSPADTARGVFSGMGVLGNLVFDPDTVPGNANYAISYTYTDSNQCANVATQMVRVDSMPVVTFSLPQDTLCASDSAVVLNGSPAVGGTGLFTGATNLTNTLFEPAVVGPGNYVLGYAFTDSNGCSDQDADSVFIPSVPAVNLSLPQYVFCEDDAAVAVTVGPAPGTLTGNGIANGDYFPNLAGPGTDTVRYVHPYGPGCEVVAVRTVTVNARPQPAIIALPAAICWNGGRVALNGVPSGGTFSGPGVDSFNNEFDPQVADSAGQGGNFAITYTFTDANGCTAFTQETIRVDPLPGLSVAGNYSNFAYCSNEARDSLLGSPAGGSFFGAGITANGVFDPAQVPGAGPDTTVTATIAYTYTDSLGCTDTLPVPVTVNALPNLMLNGLAAEYCLNADPDTLFGGPAGGDFIGMGMTMGDSVFKPDSVGQWTIGYAYTDPNTGCRDTVTEATEVYPLPQAFFSGLDSTYCINGDSAVLSGSPGDSTWFTGNGIGGNGATYFPEIAGTGGDTVVYFVQDANDCVDSLAQVTVVHDTVPVNITVPPGPRVCFNEGATQLAAVPPGGTWSGVGIVDSTGVLFPGQLDTLSYRGMYQFTSANGCTSIDTADYVGIAPPSLTLNNLAGQYCENNAPDTLVISPAWDALLVNGTALPNAVFVPDSGLRGPVGVEIFYQDPATGCRDTLRDSTRVYPAPSVDFGYAGTCVGDTTFFTDSTALDAIGSLPPDGLAFWTWNFGTGNSVANQDPSFLFASADTHTVALTVVTAQGCRDSAQQVVDIGANPVAEFTWRYVCEGNRTEFLNASTADLNDTIVTYAWSLGDGTTNNSAAPQHIYPSVGRYSVRLVLATESECVDTLVREVAIRPVIDQFPYVEDFENGPGGWLPENPERNVNWEFGTPAGLVLTGAASGDSAWATQLAGNYPNSDTATLGGPCFDLGALLRPMIRLNVNYELEAGRDGVVLQVSTDGGLVWENLGEVNSGLNWFDDFGIRGEPGNEIFNPDAEGWTGASGGWRQARHKLDRYRTAGDSLRFRIAFGSNGTNVREGFAVDDLRIEERNRTVLLENFTSAVDPASVTFDQSLNQLVAANPGNVVAVYYHLGENDPFFAANNDGEALLEHYQKQSSPYAVMDGNWYAGGTGRWLAAADTNQLALDKRLLTTAPFAIQNLSRTVTGNSVAAAADFVYGGDSTWTDSLRFFLVVVEREITGLTGIPNGNGQMDFPWVMKALLPDGPEGRRLDTTWTPGAAAYSVSGTWNLGPGQSIYDTSQVGVVAFVRRIADKEILQAAYLGLNPDPITDAEEAQAGGREELLVFPNPAAELVNVVAPGRRLDAVRLVDLPGRILWEGRPRTSRAQIDVRGLAEGVYFVQVTVKGQVETRKVVVRR